MNERILKALMQLFALVANVDGVTNRSRRIVELFLKQQLNQELVETYLTIYDDYLEVHHKISSKKTEGRKKRTSLNSVKVLKICTQINSELTQVQKIVVLIRLLEYIYSNEEIKDQDIEFVTTVSETFNINQKEFEAAKAFIASDEENIPDAPNLLVIDKEPQLKGRIANKHIQAEAFSGSAVVLNIESVDMFVLRYFGDSELNLNGQLINRNVAYFLTQGASIRSSKVSPVYFSDIIGQFLADQSQAKITFAVDSIEYEFKGGKIGLQDLSFKEQSGRMIGIMGGSGAGKSTLLNVLNGNNQPTRGAVTINGIDIHRQKDEIEGVIGYVSQDDLLIEDLTVFQNLFYNAKLCFSKLNDAEITEVVEKMLASLGLLETRDLKVGSPLEKTISGGQRKRLNIALELIREPSVLFVDEPTSGLSSRDSENIMDLLKELALKGKLVFVVIHQPSSEIFKMFDKLLILDVGGYPIYYGNPVDSVIYFKTSINHVTSQESECITCGNVNPEQIFNIIESKVLDEYGNLTDKRKISPKEWNDRYLEKLAAKTVEKGTGQEVPKSSFEIPNKIKQFLVFVTRDILSKLTNRQYMLINFLEAPALALILSYFVKFYNKDVSNTEGYIYFENENIVAYIFMSVVVALFLGLTVSAEEIIKDQRIRKRESFLNLSNSSYLISKIIIMFAITAIQALSFVLVGNGVLEIHGMHFDYWLVLFSAGCFANMLGLNISASFNSAITIYILIPFLIIPQLIFSGVIVKFDKLNPAITSQTEVPIIGEVMASRWAFEALAVNQYKNNAFEEMFYEQNKSMSIANFKKVFWIPQLKAKVGFIQNNLKHEDRKAEVKAAVDLLRSELTDNNEFNYESANQLTIDLVNKEVLGDVSQYLNNLNKHYIKQYNKASDDKDAVVSKLQRTKEAKEAFNKVKNAYTNENLSDLVKNANEFNQIIEVDGRLIQRADPVYNDPPGFRGHFYSPTRLLFGTRVGTFWANTIVVWFMSFILMITLKLDLLRRIINRGN